MSKTTDQTITYKENSQSKASIPVEAPMAVLLMKQLIEQIPTNVLYPTTSKSISQRIRKLIARTGNEESNISKSLEMQIEEIANSVQELEDVAELLLRNSLAITADKATLLKALEPTDCIGLRFYQCISGNSTAEPKELSLVIVAVDRENTDFGYKFDPSVRKEIEKIETKSFLAEYNKTSGPLDFYHLDEGNVDLKPYVLLKFALNATDHPNPPTSSSSSGKSSS